MNPKKGSKKSSKKGPKTIAKLPSKTSAKVDSATSSKVDSQTTSKVDSQTSSKVDSKMDVSPYLAAIQKLKGKNKFEKYKELERIAKQIIDKKESYLLDYKTDHVDEALLPTLHIVVGIMLRSTAAIAKAFQSDDVNIVRMALKAKWYFKPNNELFTFTYFHEHIFPKVSLRTRVEIFKALGKCLKRMDVDMFHSFFKQEYGYQEVRPMLLYCTEFYAIQMFNITHFRASDRELKKFYREYPKAVIRYFHRIKCTAANKNNKIDTTLVDYIKFLPNLVKDHPKDYVEFCLNIWQIHSKEAQMGKIRAQYFLKNCTDALIKHPKVFLDGLPLKLVKKHLSQEQYDTMLRNWFPEHFNDLSDYYTALHVIKYYPRKDGFALFRTHYQEIYGRDLMQRHAFFRVTEIYQILPIEIKTEYAENHVKKISDKSEYWHLVYKLPPKEAIPLLKSEIKKETYLKRNECLCYMLECCDYYQSKDDLLEVLEYYVCRHINEQVPVLFEWLNCLARLFNKLKSLDREHWKVIEKVICTAYVKGQFFDPNYQSVSVLGMLSTMLNFFFKLCNKKEINKADDLTRDNLIDIILECYCKCDTIWDFYTMNEPELEQTCLEYLIQFVVDKYPVNEEIWDEQDTKFKFTTYFIEKIGKVNEKIIHNPICIDEPKKMRMEDYPWVKLFATELLIELNDEVKKSATKENSNELLSYKRLLKEYCPEFYQEMIDKHQDMVYDVTSQDALLVLRRNPKKILSKVNEYVLECRNQMILEAGKGTKNFVRSLQWHHELPIKFVEKCLAEIETEGSFMVLGLLVEDKVLSKIAEPYLPTVAKLDIGAENAKKHYAILSEYPRALNFTSILTSMDSLIAMCRGDYLSLALRALYSLSHRLPFGKVMAFIHQIKGYSISATKVAVHLSFEAAPLQETARFLLEVIDNEKDPGVRVLIARSVFKAYIEIPAEYSRILMQSFIQDLKADDKNIFNILMNFQRIPRDFAGRYMFELFKKFKQFEHDDKCSYTSSFANAIGNGEFFNRINENFITELVQENLLELNLHFIFHVYLFFEKRKFEKRLEVFMSILSKHLEKIDEADQQNKHVYPSFSKIDKLLADENLFQSLTENENKELNLRFVTSVLDNVSIRKFLDIFIRFNIYRISLTAPNAMSFGEECGKNIDELIDIYKSDLIIERYAEFLDRFLYQHYNNKQIEIAEGLMAYKVKYGICVGLKFLSRWHVREYDERFDKFVVAVRDSNDLLNQALLYNFLKYPY